MQTTSALYNSILASNYWCEVKVDIAGTEYGMDTLTKLRTARAPFGTGTPALGKAVAGELELSVYASSAAIPRMAVIRPYIRIRDLSRVSERLPKGVYYIDTRETDDNGLLTIRAYDAMLKAERSQPWSELSWPATDIDAVNEIATILGVTLDSRTAALMTAGFRIPMPAQYTMRETLAQIAALYGGSFVMTDEGKLRLVCLWDTHGTADSTIGGGMWKLSLAPAFPAVTGITFLTDSETEVSAGTGSGYVFEIPCPWATQAAADWLLQQMQGFCYLPFTAQGAVLDPAVEPGDTLSLRESLRTTWSEELDFGALYTADIEAPADEELDHEYPYESTQERNYVRRMKNMESQLTLQAQAISAKVSRVGGSASSFGWYLDADRFSLMSNNLEVMRVDSAGLTVQGTVNATAGEIGGCQIVNGVLTVSNANIDNINASKITAGTLNVGRIASKSLTGAKIADETLASGKLADGAAVNRVISNSAVSYAKTSFQGTLDQVGTNKANIDTIFGYFTGSANFSSLSAANFWLNGYRLNAGTSTPYGNLVTWSNS